MEETEVSSIKKVEGGEIGVQTLKVMLSRGLLPSLQWVGLESKGREFLSKEIPFEHERWGVWPETRGESELLKGLKLADELSEVKRQVDDLDSQVKSVVSELQQCKKGIGKILNELRERPITKQTELFEIDETLEVIRPIPVVIEEYGDEVFATFPEIEVFGAGSCEAEAIINLKNEIRKIFFELEGVSDNELGKLPQSWKRVLLKVVRKIGNTQ